MKKIYIKIGEDTKCKMWSYKLPKNPYDYIVEDYPEDFIGNEKKYFTSIENDELIFIEDINYDENSDFPEDL